MVTGADLARALAGMTLEDVSELRARGLAEQRAEKERRDALALPHPVGSVCMYKGLEERALLVRVNDDDLYPRYADPDARSQPRWHIFWDYRTEVEVEDYQLDHAGLSDPVTVLTIGQLRELGLADD